jgi:septum formation protein
MPLWIAAKSLVLASQSEVRRRILAAAGIPVEVRPAPIDERAIEARSGLRTANDVARVLAGAKAHTVAAQMPGRLVLGADQTLTLGEQRFSKPATREAARGQLRELAGKTHQLHSAIAVVRDGVLLFETLASASLTMRPLSDAFLDRYLNAVGDDVTKSVGGYQLENVGAHLFDRVEGDYFTVLGLPLLPLLDHLRRDGFVAS